MTERKTTDAALFSRILGFEIDPPGQPGAFQKRLEAETGWTAAEAKEAIAEYRRFLYLAAVSSDGATPSQRIDAVWHEHLLFTRNYDRMCREAIGRPLHHDPGTSTSDEERYRQLYLDTLASYEREFGAPPPESCWPTPGKKYPRPATAGTQSKSLMGSASFWAGGTLALAGISIADSYPGLYLSAVIGLAGSFLAAKMFGGSEAPAAAEATAKKGGRETSSGSDGGGPVYAAGTCGAGGKDGGSGGGSEGGSDGGSGGWDGGGGGCGGGCGGG